MCPFMNSFRWNINEALKVGLASETQEVIINEQCKDNLLVWAQAALYEEPLPITDRPFSPPLYRLEFTSDVAGISDSGGRAGIASIGINEDSEVVFAIKKFWEEKMLYSQDVDGKCFGCKTSLLEFTGVLLSFSSYQRN